MSVVAPPFPLFTGLDNRLLDNGFVWVGEENQDPETHPLAIYSDEAMSIPIAQPLRTKAGVLSSGDAPTNVYVAGRYSLRVRTSNGAQVFYLPSASGAFGDLAGGDGLAQVGYQQRGTGFVWDSREALREIRLGLITDNGAKWDGLTKSNFAFNQLFQYLSATRVYDYQVNGTTQFKGVGRLSAPKGRYIFDAVDFGGINQVGMEIGGHGVYTTTFDFALEAGQNAFTFRNYSWVNIHDIAFRNTGAYANTCALDFNSQGGGNNVTLDRLEILGYQTCIRMNGDTVNGVATPGDGDKVLAKQVVMGGAIGYDQTRAGQSYGWYFMNCSSACTLADFKLGGLGSTTIVNHIGNPLGSFLKLPERTGGGGSARDPARNGGGGYVAGNYPLNSIAVENTKLEYHDQGDRLLVDARESLLRADQGGSTAVVSLRNVSIASGGDWPVPGEHVVIQVGNDERGSDGLRLHQDGGWISGIVHVGSDASGPVNVRWHFRDGVKAPDPKLVRLRGGGSHYLMEWRANENVPVDQYRGGQAFTGSIDAEKAYMWGQLGPRLVNTAPGLGADAQIGDRFGGQFTLTDFSPGATIKGMAVQLEKSPGTDTVVEWFAIGGGGLWMEGPNQLIGSATIPAGAPAGKIFSVADLAMEDWRLLQDGNVFVRITKPGQALETFGRLLVFYFPRIPLVA